MIIKCQYDSSDEDNLSDSDGQINRKKTKAQPFPDSLNECRHFPSLRSLLEVLMV